MKTLDKALHEDVKAGLPSGSAPVLDPELYFEPTLPHYPVVSYAWVSTGSDRFDELNALDIAKPWRVW